MIKRYNNLFIYECGTRWQVSSQEHALAPQGRAMCHKDVQSQSDWLVVPDGRIRLTWPRNCTSGIRWRCDEDRDAECCNEDRDAECCDEDRDTECCDAATNQALDSRIRTSRHVTSGNKIFSSGNVTLRSSRQWWGEVLKRRCCQVKSKGNTDKVGP